MTEFFARKLTERITTFPPMRDVEITQTYGGAAFCPTELIETLVERDDKPPSYSVTLRGPCLTQKGNLHANHRGSRVVKKDDDVLPTDLLKLLITEDRMRAPHAWKKEIGEA